jgi:L-asparagine oxygenase
MQLSTKQQEDYCFEQFLPESFLNFEDLNASYRSCHSCELSEVDKLAFDKYISRIINKSDQIELWRHVKSINDQLTPFDRFEIKLKESLSTQGYFLYKNLPFDQLKLDEKSGFKSELCLLFLSKILGEPYGYSSQRAGQIIQNLRPILSDANKQLGSNSVDLLWHTEDAHFEKNCDYILLACLRGAGDARTLISFVDPSLMSAENLNILEEESFEICSDESFTKKSISATKFAIISKGPNPRVRFDPMYTKCQNPKHFEALLELNRQINVSPLSIALEHGDLLVIDNRSAVHARTKYTPNFDGKDRWLQRVNVFNEQVPASMLEDSERNIING